MRKAFTMLEIVFVIVIIAVLAAVFFPRMSSNKTGEAAVQVLSHIRYTQHLAMIDDKFDENNATWFMKKWQIRFRLAGGQVSYAVYYDKNANRNVGPDADEVAVDMATGKRMQDLPSTTEVKMNLTRAYGITNVVDTCNVADSSLFTTSRGVVSFDFLGRPYRGIGNQATGDNQYTFLQTADCDITLVGDTNVTIRVTPETGYARIL